MMNVFLSLLSFLSGPKPCTALSKCCCTLPLIKGHFPKAQWGFFTCLLLFDILDDSLEQRRRSIIWEVSLAIQRCTAIFMSRLFSFGIRWFLEPGWSDRACCTHFLIFLSLEFVKAYPWCWCIKDIRGWSISIWNSLFSTPFLTPKLEGLHLILSVTFQNH